MGQKNVIDIKDDDPDAALAQKVCKILAAGSWQQIIRGTSLSTVPFLSEHQRVAHDLFCTATQAS